MPKAKTEDKEIQDWRAAEMAEEWELYGPIYIIGKTIAFVVVVSFMAGVIYGLIMR